ncbi:hypothetical protein ECML10_000173 [Escherichia phage ECML-10]|nr:hypothetical protein ECML10_000173 [Escherichia phage ECML-10]
MAMHVMVRGSLTTYLNRWMSTNFRFLTRLSIRLCTPSTQLKNWKHLRQSRRPNFMCLTVISTKRHARMKTETKWLTETETRCTILS